VEELGPSAAIEGIKASVANEHAQRAIKPADLEREIRTRCGVLHRQIFERTQAETTKRWVFEQEIRRPYFHISDLDESQIQNWRRYLDFEESEGQHARVRFLYERCLVTTAMYEEFWLRYARWVLGQSSIEKAIRLEEVRYIYRRACCYFVPISSPTVRLNYAKFEESLGNPESAIDVLEDVLRVLPGHIETIIALVNVHRRSSGVDDAIDVLSRHIAQAGDSQIRPALVVEKTRLVWRIKGDSAQARAIFQEHYTGSLDSRQFWVGWFDFEAAQPTSQTEEPANFERIKHVYDLSREAAQLPEEVSREMSSLYFRYLDERGGASAMEDFIELDRQVNGPRSTSGRVESHTKPENETPLRSGTATTNGVSRAPKSAGPGIQASAHGYGINGS
jgi:pre-mRNA-processing factor 39